MIKKKESDDDNPYFKYQYHKISIICVLIFISLAVAIYSMMSGDYHISFSGVINTLFGNGDEVESVVIFNVRLPRIAAAILVGSSLAVAGTIMQCVLKNPLASAYTLGISSAAAFGAAFALAASYFGWFAGNMIGEALGSTYGMSLFAFLWAMVAVLVVLAFSRTTHSTSESMILAGVAISAIFGAALSSLQYFVDDSVLSEIVYWQFGDLGKAVWGELAIILVIFIPIVCYFIYKRMDYNAMSAGEEIAHSLGINTKRTTILGMVFASVLAAVCISIVGIIGFVGLLGPHIMRRIIGNDHRFLLPASMVMGSLVLLVSDAIGRLAFESMIPVGIITSFLGGPLFLYILIKKRRR